ATSEVRLPAPSPEPARGFPCSSRRQLPSPRSDALPVIAVIVVAFVLLAVLIVLAVHYGPQLRTVQITLHHEPLPQHMDGVLLTDWRLRHSCGKLPAMDSAGASCHCSCSHHLPHGSAEPNVIEITYL
uniref:Small integral membrane protein 33 n=1 Tax=Malurus cyaneus samueli TaxID=2593467 RepID=A0A8C5U0B6_9PASS